MPSATLTSKGQITIPAEVRAALGVSFGDRIDFVEVEKGWVMRSFYDASRQQIQRVVEALLRTRGVIVERSDLVWMALGEYCRGNADFGDYLIEQYGREAGCEYTLTFDRSASNTAGMKLLR